jgi:thiosulfate/3-mercaptopyruvate sulfurtransferase
MTSFTLIEAEQLAARLDEADLRIFDCRFDLARPDAGRERYAEDHLPGATYADLNRDLAAPPTAASGRHPLPEPAEFESRLRAWGVNTGSTVVAYDDGNAMYAARLWWMMRWLGHDRALVLDGGMRRWLQLDLPLEDHARPPAAPGNFVARPRHAMAADAAAVLASTRDTSVRLLDARGAERFRGEVEPIDPVAGHVPGARNHPFTLSLGADGRFLPRTELRAALEQRLGGVTPGRTIAMCGSGVSACHLLLAMEHAGLGGARLYPGSWSEWSRDPSRPVAVGADP